MIITENCQQTVTCIRVITSSILSGILIIVGIVAMIHIYKFRNKFGYELLPLLAATSQALIHLNDYLFYSSNHMAEISNYLQVITFAFIAQKLKFKKQVLLFHNIFSELKNNTEVIEKIKKQLLCSQVFQVGFYSIMFILFIIFAIKTHPKSCNEYFYSAFVIIIVQILVSCVYANFYGYKLVNAIEIVGSVRDLDDQKKQPEKKTQNAEITFQLVQDPQIILEYEDRTNEHVQLIEERMKQIKSVSFGMAFTTICYILILSFSGFFLKNYECDYEFQDITWEENIQLFLLSLVQLTPCIYLSIAFYYIPKVERLEKVNPIFRRRQDDFDLKFDMSMQKRDSIVMSARDDLFVQRLRKSERSHKKQSFSVDSGKNNS